MTRSFLIRAFFCVQHSALLSQPFQGMLRDYDREIDGGASCEVYGCQSIGASKGFVLSRAAMLEIDYLDRVRFFFFLFPLLASLKKERLQQQRHQRRNRLADKRFRRTGEYFSVIAQFEGIQV